MKIKLQNPHPEGIHKNKILRKIVCIQYNIIQLYHHHTCILQECIYRALFVPVGRRKQHQQHNLQVYKYQHLYKWNKIHNLHTIRALVS